MGLKSRSIKAGLLSNSAIKLFQKAYDKLVMADKMILQSNFDIEDELRELELEKQMNEKQLEINAKVKENLKQFLPITDENHDS
jgi:hypothetical protein